MSSSQVTASPTLNQWSSYMKTLYASRKPPVLGSVDFSVIENAAREKLKYDERES